MAQGYRITGLVKLQAKLKELPEAIKRGAIEDIQDAADAIVMKAILKVPVDLGVLKQSIGNQPKNGGLNYIVYVSAEYAPYIEWGTGTEVQVPDALVEYASQFRGAGNVRNIPAQPFFFEGFFEEKDELVKKLKQTIADNL